MKNYKKEIELVLEALKKKGYDRGEIEKTLGYSENYIDQVLSRGGNKKALLALENYNRSVLQKAIFEDQHELQEAAKLLGIPGVSLIEGKADIKEYIKKSKEVLPAINNEKISVMVIFNLTESNMILAESNRTIAEANRTLADNNRDLIVMLKGMGNFSK